MLKYFGEKNEIVFEINQKIENELF